MTHVLQEGGDVLPPAPTTTSTGTDFGSAGGPTDPTGTSANGGTDFGSGTSNPYLPTGGTSSGTSSSGSTKTSSSGSTHTSSGSTKTSSGSSHQSAGTETTYTTRVVTTRQRIVTTYLVGHPVRVKWKSTNSVTGGTGGTVAGKPPAAPLDFVAIAGITSHERRYHASSALHVTPHRRSH
jgi:hypothetical protein